MDESLFNIIRSTVRFRSSILRTTEFPGDEKDLGLIAPSSHLGSNDIDRGGRPYSVVDRGEIERGGIDRDSSGIAT